MGTKTPLLSPHKWYKEKNRGGGAFSYRERSILSSRRERERYERKCDLEKGFDIFKKLSIPPPSLRISLPLGSHLEGAYKWYLLHRMSPTSPPPVNIMVVRTDTRGMIMNCSSVVAVSRPPAFTTSSILRCRVPKRRWVNIGIRYQYKCITVQLNWMNLELVVKYWRVTYMRDMRYGRGSIALRTYLQNNVHMPSSV